MYKQSDSDKRPLLKILRSVQDKNEYAQLALLEKFSCTIRSFSYKLNYDGADTDLIIFLLGLCQTMDLSGFENDGALVKYIYNSLRHEYIRLSKLNNGYKINEQLYGIDPSEIANNSKSIEDSTYSDVLMADELVNILTRREKQIVIYVFKLGYSDAETARIMDISRQAVGKTKKRALQKLKYKFYENE